MNDKIPKATEHIIESINHFNQQSARLFIKKFTDYDVEFNLQHEMDPIIMRYIRDPISIEAAHTKTIKCAQEWTGAEQEWALFSVRLTNTDDYMGIVCLSYESLENDTVEMGWRFGLEHHGKGYATEAARCLLDFIKTTIKPHKVVAYCITENTASSNIMTKLGMQQEACLRQFSKLGGHWYDESIYGLILN
jgi:RimJ/RimL family protein N-acetyltransferase